MHHGSEQYSPGRAFRPCQPDIELVGVAGDGAEAIELAVLSKPDVVLMDLQMPDQSGIDATRAITAKNPRWPCSS